MASSIFLRDDCHHVRAGRRMHPNKRLSLNVASGEIEVGKAITAAGGTWDTRRNVWKLAYKQVVA